MGKLWKEYHGEIIGGAVTLLVTIGAIIWAFLRSWVGPLIIPLAIGTFGLGLFVINQWGAMTLRWRKRNLEDYVFNMLYRLGLGVKREKETDNDVFRMSVGIGREGVTIWQAKNRPEYLVVGVELVWSEQEYKIVDKITINPQSTLLEDLKIALAQLGVAYTGVQHPIRSVMVMGQTLCLDLEQSNLLEAIELVRRGGRLVAAMITKEERRVGKVSPGGKWQHDPL